MAKVGYKLQDAILHEHGYKPFSFNYDLKDFTITIDVKPNLTMVQKKEFVDIVASMCIVGDEYIPSNFETAVKIAAFYTFTNIKIDLDKIDRTYELADTSPLYDELVVAMNGRSCLHLLDNLIKAARDYIEWKKQELLASKHKHTIDTLLEELLEKANVALDKFVGENSDLPAKDLLQALANAKSLNDEGKLVGQILNFRSDKETDKDDRSGKEGTGTPK